jgi:Putative cyclase
MADYTNLPDFDSLPSVKDMPQGCAWGVFDKDGKKDHLGCVNLLTPAVVKDAYKEAKEGISVSLNWPIGAINTPGFQRKGLVHKVMSFKEGPFNLHGFDDEVEFNTQCSSQWDSLVHFHHQPSGTGYNGCKPTVAQLEQTFGNEDKSCDLPTLNHWHTRGGIVGRGVLIDYRAYAADKGIKYSVFDDHAITVKDIEDVAKHQGTSFKHGDILIVRSGFTEDLGGTSAKTQEQNLGSHKCIGVEGSKEVAKWVWNHHFAAVAGDAIAFEVLPPKKADGSVGGIDELGELTSSNAVES